MTEAPLLFLMLALAAASGWYLGTFRWRKRVRLSSRLSRNYFQGLNYLLNEEPDKAIEVFEQIAEVNRDTVETHLALGKLFRRRGEIDKAISFHKHIISRPNLSDALREQALMALGEDYMHAGLLDRAERLFTELLQIAPGDEKPARQLLAIYQQEKDWGKAVDVALRLGPDKDDVRRMVAQFHCEIAEQALAAGEAGAVLASLRQARRYDPKHPRPRLLEARLASRQGEWARAAALLREACQLDPECLVACVDTLIDAHRRSGNEALLRDWLFDLLEQQRLSTAALALAALLAEEDPDAARALMLKQLEQRPSVKGLECLMDLLDREGGDLERIEPALIRDLASRLLKGQPTYRCQHCGFSGNAHHWSCPSCRRWNTTRVITGVLGE